jgi:hypothetical protein
MTEKYYFRALAVLGLLLFWLDMVHAVRIQQKHSLVIELGVALFSIVASLALSKWSHRLLLLLLAADAARAIAMSRVANLSIRRTGTIIFALAYLLAAVLYWKRSLDSGRSGKKETL